jgi:hypothetical protein
MRHVRHARAPASASHARRSNAPRPSCPCTRECHSRTPPQCAASVMPVHPPVPLTRAAYAAFVKPVQLLLQRPPSLFGQSRSNPLCSGLQHPPLPYAPTFSTIFEPSACLVHGHAQVCYTAMPPGMSVTVSPLSWRFTLIIRCLPASHLNPLQQSIPFCSALSATPPIHSLIQV